MSQFNVNAPRQNDYDDDIDEITSLRGELKQVLARIERLEKMRTGTVGTATTTQTVISSGGSSTPGADGADGADGTAATIEVGATTTGDPGTEASVTNAGSTSAAVLNFVIPRGEQGPPGPDGAGDNYTLELEGFPGSPSGIVDILRFTAAFVLNNMGDSLTGEGRLRVEIDLANLGVAGTYDLGGGASVTLDDYGRVTAITPVP